MEIATNQTSKFYKPGLESSKMNKILLLLLLSLFVVTIPAQTPTPAPAAAQSFIKDKLAAGEVSSINQTDKKIALQTSDGAIDIIILATTGFKRVPPENPVITAAVDASITDIGEKDKVLVTGAVSADKKTFTAKNIYLMSKSDISKKLTAEREAWRTRSISGRVTKVDFKTKEVTVATRGMMGETDVVVSPKENAEFLRYAPDSAKYADAVASNVAEIKVGDQLRALGDKSTDGLTFKAEKYLTGSFKTVAGKITAIDTAKNEITIEDSLNKKPTVIVVSSTTQLKQFPAEMAQNMARMMMMSSMGGGMQPAPGGQGGNATFTMTRPNGQEARPANPQGGQPNGQAQPTNNGQPNGQGQPNGGNPNGGQRQFGMNRGTGGNGNLDDLLERVPTITIAELKVGDTIGVSSTPGNVPNRFNAIKLVSGVEPFLNMPQIQIGGRNGGNQPTINIPGLDGGFGNP